MTWVIRILVVVYAAVAALFAIAGVALIVFAVRTLWHTLASSAGIASRAAGVIEGMGTLAVALVALEIAQTIVEEEVIRRAQVSAPTRVRRYLSRFLVVVVVALSIKYLVAVVKFLQDDHRALWNASSIGFATAALVIAWAVFIRLNRAAEELEPEAMEEAKREDRKVQ